ncbi:MAG: autotransporter domain-containing protein [Proteobacteria bacterium]|nr:autotransporter domain-containing protein [Pseudomonadota bacterium]
MGYRNLAATLVATSALTCAVSVAALTPVRAADFIGLGFLPGGVYSNAFGLSADGTVVAGQADGADGFPRAFRWSGGVMTNLGTLGGNTSYGLGVSGDGSAVVGYSNLADNTTYHAFRWSGGVMTDLGTLGGTHSEAHAVSADGATVVGYAQITGNTAQHAFRWNGGTMTDLGTLGGTNSLAKGVSGDGSVVVGVSDISLTTTRAFRWSGGVMTDLGTLGGSSSTASAVSIDGTTVVGSAHLSGDVVTHAFRWNGGSMTDLGVLSGGTYSTAAAVSGDGSVVVGISTTSGGGYLPFRWTAGTGMQSIPALLTAAGVNLGPWLLVGATGVSADGTVITGSGIGPTGQYQGWLARFSTTYGTGLITPDVVSQSFSGLSSISHTGNAAIDGTLGTLTQIATQGGNDQGGSPYSVFGYGAYDSDPVATGSLGITARLPDKMLAGAMVSAHVLRTTMVYDGDAKMQGGSAAAFLARVPDAGLQWMLGVSGLTMSGDITRGYINGASQTSSHGNTTGNGFGAMGRIGWTFDRIWRATQLTPFASYTFSRTHLNGYTESGGPFPAQIDAFNGSANILRLGADARYTVAPGKWLWGGLASTHRLNNSRSDDISGTLLGLFSTSAPATSVAKDWLEATAGVRWQAWRNGFVSASVTAAVPVSYAATYQVRLGLTQTF